MNACTVPTLWIPIADVVVCLNCDCCFRICSVCPACASEHIMSLARWLDRPA